MKRESNKPAAALFRFPSFLFILPGSLFCLFRRREERRKKGQFISPPPNCASLLSLLFPVYCTFIFSLLNHPSSASPILYWRYSHVSLACVFSSTVIRRIDRIRWRSRWKNRGRKRYRIDGYGKQRRGTLFVHHRCVVRRWCGGLESEGIGRNGLMLFTCGESDRSKNFPQPFSFPWGDYFLLPE